MHLQGLQKRNSHQYIEDKKSKKKNKMVKKRNTLVKMTAGEDTRVEQVVEYMGKA
jgi:hypothetical protein